MALPRRPRPRCCPLFGVILQVALGILWCRPVAVVPPPCPTSGDPHRRGALYALGVATALARPGAEAAFGVSADDTNLKLEVRPDCSGEACFPSIGAALRAHVGKPVTLVLRPGLYRERVVVEAGVQLKMLAEPQGEAIVVWETSKPYEAVLAAEAGATVEVSGVRFRHASKSVANNYAIFAQSADVTLENCDVTSSTGAGVAAEGGRISIFGGLVHDCARQGLSLFGPIGGDQPLRVVVKGTMVRGNGNSMGDGDAIRGPFDGVLAIDSVEAEFNDVTVEGSGGAGVAVGEEARIVFVGGGLQGNRKGPSREFGGDFVLAKS